VSALKQDILKLIAQEGPLSVERYMALCLGHPAHGYYMTRDPLGAKGDFITAPEISQMFGELIGLWAAQAWLDMGQPDQLRLIECGPGRGTLMQDALRAAATIPGFLQALRVDLVETSPVLKAEQLRRLSGCGVPVDWHASLQSIPSGIPRIILGNEFLDALPVRQYVRQDGGWHERLVGVDGEALVFGLAPYPEKTLTQEAPEGAILEIASEAQRFVTDLAAGLKADGGAALFIDYGHGRTGFGDTLQAIMKHAFVDPLANPGDADLTAHVDFDALSRTAKAAGLSVHGPVEQGPFLRNLGLQVRAEMLMQKAVDDGQRLRIKDEERRLTDNARTGMGKLFKAIAFTAPGQPAPPAFDDASGTG
jgi:NADH dehydrogenase [ubiquinone] 1 alpha subcomplex assembly factor 7